MLNLLTDRPVFFKNALFITGLISSLFLTGCQSMPWSETASVNDMTADGTLSATENPSVENVTVTVQIMPEKQQQPALSSVVPEPSEKDIIWDRLVSGFSMNMPDNKRIKREYDWYRKHPEYLARVQERAEPFLHYILDEAERRNLPTELVLLPVVESAFEPFAYSPGRAAGLWQFIPSTGRMFGLEQNWWHDGRRDVIASTNAAFDYLTSLSEAFNGDWELALAAYNAGAGNVRKAIRKNKKKHKPTDYWSLNLPRETQTYVPRLLAISKIFKNAKKLGITLRPIENKPQLAIIEMDTQIDLAKAAEMASITLEEMYQLNPAFNRWATSPDRSHKLLLPLSAQSEFEQKLASLDKKDLIKWQRYKIKSGDSLGQIAKKHQTTTAILKDVNKLPSSRIRAGKHLLIPVSIKNPDSYRLSATQRLKKKQNQKRGGNRIEHIVQPGDTLWDIARSHKLSHKKIAQWNGIAPGDPLRPGQKLVLWLKSSKTDSTLAFSDTPANRVSNIRYTIRKGDSLSRVADKFNVSVSDLKKWNQLNKRYLQPGQKLKLKVHVTEQL